MQTATRLEEQPFGIWGFPDGLVKVPADECESNTKWGSLR